MNELNHLEDNEEGSGLREGGVPFTSGEPMDSSGTTNEQDQAFESDQATLQDNIKTLIDNIFRRKVDELILLQRKIDTLTEHLTNELKRTPIDDEAIEASSHIDHHVTNDQRNIIHVSAPDQGFKDEARLRSVLN